MGEEMKYVIRRAVAGVVITPLVAVAWVVFYAGLVGFGFEPTASVGEVFTNGIVAGVFISLAFVFGAVAKLKESK
jgi:hypothetical protein